MTSPANYTLGKGKIWIAPYNEALAVTKADFKEMGNCPQVSVTLAEETLEHFSSMGGVKEKDKEVPISLSYTLTINTDEITTENLVLFFQGQALPNGTIYGLSGSTQEYVIKFISDNSAGNNRTFVFHRVKVKGEGEIALISEEWMSMGLTCTGLSDSVHNPQSRFFSIYSRAGVKVISDWASGKAYKIGDAVKQSNNFSICKEDHTSSASFATDNAKWTPASAWTAGATYVKDAVVSINGKIYQAAEGLTSKAAFGDDEGYWILIAE